MESVKITYTRKKDEFIRAYRKYLIGRKLIRKRHIILATVILLVSIFLYHSSKNPLWLVMLTLYTIIIFLCCFVLYFLPIKNYQQMAKAGVECTLTFSSNGIDYQTAQINTHMKWNLYKELWEDKEFFFLIYDAGTYTAIPKRVFADYGELKKFQGLVTKTLMVDTRTL